MVGTARDEEARHGEPKSGSRVKTNREETKRTSKEAMDRWNKAGETWRNWGYKIGKKEYTIEESGRFRRRQKLLKSCDAMKKKKKIYYYYARNDGDGRGIRRVYTRETVFLDVPRAVRYARSATNNARSF